MGEPVIISDGSPVKICWFGDDDWTADQSEKIWTRAGELKLDWMLFNLVNKVDVTAPLQMKVNFKLKSQKTAQTLLVSTDSNRMNLRLEIANLPANRKFSDVFAPARGDTDDKKFLTPEDASITGIFYQLGGGKVQQAKTLKNLPTTIFLGLAG